MLDEMKYVYTLGMHLAYLENVEGGGGGGG